MSSSRERSQTTKPNVSIPRGGRLPSLIFALSRNPNRLPPRTHAFFEMLEKATAREGRIGGESRKEQRSENRGQRQRPEFPNEPKLVAAWQHPPTSISAPPWRLRPVALSSEPRCRLSPFAVLYASGSLSEICRP